MHVAAFYDRGELPYLSAAALSAEPKSRCRPTASDYQHIRGVDHKRLKTPAG